MLAHLDRTVVKVHTVPGETREPLDAANGNGRGAEAVFKALSGIS